MKHIAVVVILAGILSAAWYVSALQAEETAETIPHIDVTMCALDDCEELFIDAISSAENTVYCAFFSFNLDRLYKALQESTATKLVIVDGDFTDIEDTFIVHETRSGYMHNKFCIIDEKKVVTGSFNPTYNGRDKNDNNVLSIHSNNIAATYLWYFQQLATETYAREQGASFRPEQPRRYSHYDDAIKICFTRGGNCREMIRDAILSAQQTITLMQFTLTDDLTTQAILQRHYENITVQGIFDRTLITRYSGFHEMHYHNLSIIRDCLDGKMHHKVIIIDDHTVLAGSMNPSRNADVNNDENLIIVKDKRIAEKYLKEFDRLYSSCMT